MPLHSWCAADCVCGINVRLHVDDVACTATFMTRMQWHAGVPLHLEVRSVPELERLQEALPGMLVASVRLLDVPALPAKTAAALVSALAGSAATLHAVHGLPLQYSQDIGLAALTQLRAVTLDQAGKSPVLLRATQLPASLEELTLRAVRGNGWALPWIEALDSLRNLRCITFVGYKGCHLRSWDRNAGPGPVQLPPGLRVRTICPAPALKFPA